MLITSDKASNRVVDLLVHTAHARSSSSFEVDETGETPGGAPRVSNDEVWHVGRCISTIADSDDGVVEGGTASGSVCNDTTGVLLED